MRNVGIFEGKTHFSALIKDVQAGETIIVTKNGEPVAQIVPIPERRSEADAAMDRILSRRVGLNDVTIRDLIDEGRRY
jgi:prevent-host-death family protein